MVVHENRVEKNITYKLLNYENFDKNLKASFFLALAKRLGIPM